MNEIAEQLDRLLAARVTPELLRAAEAGAFAADLWGELEAMGLPLALVPEGLGGAGLGFAEAAPLWLALGRHAAPVPLGEAMLGAGLLGAAGVAPPTGVLTVATSASAVPFGRDAAHVVLGAVALHRHRLAAARTNLTREPRDAVDPGAALAEGTLPDRHGPRAIRFGLALLRAAQMAGAVEKALALAVDWANTRQQFGRPIGRFQAVQQQLAAMAGEVAAAGTAVTLAARAADARGLDGAAFEIACAKIVAGEAATLGAATAHQVFAAMGITEEHELHRLTRRLWAWRDEGGNEKSWAEEVGRDVLARGGAALWPDLTARDVA
ncbi:MAG: acyl-CoA dehydrogenase family protein [Acetobacteraceae bacterium]|nr:acyl-CoA dehydrogenase family protein [Acetobacteraceae bacterium]